MRNDPRFPYEDRRAYNTSAANALRYNIPRSAPTLWCARCGSDMAQCCVHEVAVVWNGVHAERIRARYAFGKLYNPDHDQTSYRDGNEGRGNEEERQWCSRS